MVAFERRGTKVWSVECGAQYNNWPIEEVGGEKGNGICAWL